MCFKQKQQNLVSNFVKLYLNHPIIILSYRGMVIKDHILNNLPHLKAQRM